MPAGRPIQYDPEAVLDAAMQTFWSRGYEATALPDLLAALVTELLTRHPTLAGVHLDLPRYDRNRVDGCWMSDAEISAVVERLWL